RWGSRPPTFGHASAAAEPRRATRGEAETDARAGTSARTGAVARAGAGAFRGLHAPALRCGVSAAAHPRARDAREPLLREPRDRRGNVRRCRALDRLGPRPSRPDLLATARLFLLSGLDLCGRGPGIPRASHRAGA